MPAGEQVKARAHSQPITEAVYSASELARGTVPSKAIGHLGFRRPRRQNWHSMNPPLAWEKPPSPSAEISVAATCVKNAVLCSILGLRGANQRVEACASDAVDRGTL